MWGGHDATKILFGDRDARTCACWMSSRSLEVGSTRRSFATHEVVHSCSVFGRWWWYSQSRISQDFSVGPLETDGNDWTDILCSGKNILIHVVLIHAFRGCMRRFRHLSFLPPNSFLSCLCLVAIHSLWLLKKEFATSQQQILSPGLCCISITQRFLPPQSQFYKTI